MTQKPNNRPPNHALQRTRPSRYCCNPTRLVGRVAELGSLCCVNYDSILTCHMLRFVRAYRLIPWLVHGYTRPLARHERTTQEANAKFLRDTERSDELAAAVSIGAFQCLEKGDTDQAKHKLVWAIGSYYRVYRTRGGDTNILAQIESAARKYPAIAAELSRKIE